MCMLVCVCARKCYVYLLGKLVNVRSLYVVCLCKGPACDYSGINLPPNLSNLFQTISNQVFVYFKILFLQKKYLKIKKKQPWLIVSSFQCSICLSVCTCVCVCVCASVLVSAYGRVCVCVCMR